VFENRVLKGIFGPKRDEMIGGWRKLLNEELHNMYSFKMDRACSTYVEKRTACRILVGRPEGKRPLGIPRCRWGIILTWILERKNGVVWIGFV
jgi:hypothetical protein